MGSQRVAHGRAFEHVHTQLTHRRGQRAWLLEGFGLTLGNFSFLKVCIYNPTATSELPPPIAALKCIFLIPGSATLVVRQEANRESLLNSYL